MRMELGERERWRDHAEGLLTAGQGLHETLAAICSDATSEQGVYLRVVATSDAVQVLSDAGLLRGPLALALDRTLGRLLEYPEDPNAGSAAHEELVCARVRRHNITLPQHLVRSV